MDTRWVDDRIEYRYASEADIPAIARMLARPEVCEHVFFGPNSEAETRGYFEPVIRPMRESLDRGELPDAHVFVIYDRDSGAFAGECGLMPVPFGDGNFTIGYQFEPTYWGRGLGTAACRFLTWYGFGTLGARRLSGDTLSTNIGSMRVMEKCGFRKEGVQRQYFFSRGSTHDNVLFGLVRDDVPGDLDQLAQGLRPR